MTREDRRLVRRMTVLCLATVGLMIAIGYVNLWLYPPPDWLQGEQNAKNWYAKNLCVVRGFVGPCPDKNK